MRGRAWAATERAPRGPVSADECAARPKVCPPRFPAPEKWTRAVDDAVPAIAAFGWFVAVDWGQGFVVGRASACFLLYFIRRPDSRGSGRRGKSKGHGILVSYDGPSEGLGVSRIL